MNDLRYDLAIAMNKYEAERSRHFANAQRYLQHNMVEVARPSKTKQPKKKDAMLGNRLHSKMNFLTELLKKSFRL